MPEQAHSIAKRKLALETWPNDFNWLGSWQACHAVAVSMCSSAAQCFENIDSPADRRAIIAPSRYELGI